MPLGHSKRLKQKKVDTLRDGHRHIYHTLATLTKDFNLIELLELLLDTKQSE